MRAFDILVAGEINPDLILNGEAAPAFGQVEQLVDSAVLVLGSSSAIFACGAARLGLKVAFVGVCGDDLFGRFMLDEMARHGVDVSAVKVDPAIQTGLSVILSKGGDRAILTFAGSIAALRAEDITDGLLSRARHLHVASYFLQMGLQPGLPALFERARMQGLTTSLDTNWDPSEEWQGVHEVLPSVDVFLPNLNEALAITDRTSLDEAMADLSRLSRTVAVKLGAKGAAARQGDETAASPSINVRIADTVGAGDSFDAGFLYGFLHDWPLIDSLRLGCVCGALSTTRSGGTDGQPTLDEALQAVPR